jgi:GMP synthase-like glutamine amidotransferase
MARCLVVQHAGPEGSHAIGDALRTAGVDVELRRVFDGDDLPAGTSGFGGLVVMGGPASAVSDVGFPTRGAELRLLGAALQQGVPTLGVCLGAQLLALAAGGTVRPGTAGAEIGWGPVELTDEAADDALLNGLPRRLSVLHWHGDTFDLPAGATHLAASDRYSNQAFRLGDRAWGLQFHVEVDRAAVDAFLADFGEEAREAGADPDSIRRGADPNLERLAPWRDLVADRFAGLVVDRRLAPERHGGP